MNRNLCNKYRIQTFASAPPDRVWAKGQCLLKYGVFALLLSVLLEQYHAGKSFYLMDSHNILIHFEIFLNIDCVFQVPMEVFLVLFLLVRCYCLLLFLLLLFLCLFVCCCFLVFVFFFCFCFLFLFLGGWGGQALLICCFYLANNQWFAFTQILIVYVAFIIL